ncbi:hypothetical protein [Bradyrhizobium sp. McL0616]|uniref:hypothetical protein n=1 Tax=Bradyrhizobium sp. McL0616 TaxID=3415674 RepID=UPI003CEFD3DC
MARIKEPKTQIERIREISPRYADLLAKNAEFHARYEEVIAESRPLAEEARRSQVSWTAQLPKPKPLPITRHAGAAALLGDLLPEQPPEELTPPPPPPSWPGEKRLRELSADAESIAEAIKLLVLELKKARREYSLQVASLRGGEYADLSAAVVDAIKALGDAILQHHYFIDEQRRDSVGYQAFKPLNLERFGNLDEPGSPLMQTILNAVERGHVGAGKIPEWKMPADISLFQGGNL